jgi:hypothetical protein
MRQCNGAYGTFPLFSPRPFVASEAGRDTVVSGMNPPGSTRPDIAV